MAEQTQTLAGKTSIPRHPRVPGTDEACYPANCPLSALSASWLSLQVTFSMSHEPHGELSPDQAVASSAEDTIALDMFLKLATVVPSGGAAKHLIQSGAVQVNGTVETRRGRKLRPGDLVEVNGEQFVIESDGL